MTVIKGGAMEKDEATKVTEVKLAHQWLQVKEDTFAIFITDASATPGSMGTKALEWYSFEDVDGKKHNGLKSWIQDFQLRD